MTLMNMPSSTEDVDAAVFPYSALALVSDETKDGLRTATYRVDTSDQLHPLMIEVTLRKNNPVQSHKDERRIFPGGSNTCSLRMSSWVSTTEPDSSVTYRPFNAFIGFEVPRDKVVTKDELRKALGSMWALTYASVTTTTPENDAVLNRLLMEIVVLDW